MPIYEYRCQTCEEEFEELVSPGETPACPECGTTKLEKLMSAHSVGNSAAKAAPAQGACGSCEYADGPGRCGMS